MWKPKQTWDNIRRNYENLDNLSEASVNNIIFEIKFVYKLGLLGDECSVDDWLSLKKELESEN